jgi:hypothetical protein
MMSKAEAQRLKAFLRTSLVTEYSKGPVLFYVLRFYVAKPDEERIEQYVVRTPHSKKLLMDVEALFDKIQEDSQEQANGVGGRVKFRLLAYAGEGETRFISSRVFAVQGIEDAEDIEEGALPSGESPRTEGGREAQRMRHHERMASLYMNATDRVMMRLQTENDDMRGMLGVVLQKQIQLVGIVEQSLNQAEHRKLMQSREAARNELMTKGFHKVMVLVPHLINAYMGAKVIATDGPSPQEAAIREVLHSMKPDQWNNLFNVLDEVQRQPIMAIAAKMIKEEEEEKAKEAAKLSRAAPSPRQLESASDKAAE